ncbi:hypothetical protein BFN03_12635 [Rhodococcus sp. WMMA185]|uniref:hypothetical protein n=1 Tax=Rhodococcus sp. WMMA185 TaxID=679318 RepID=UPI000878B315|nr:hypothetical protein [Rhodococcus sp. WMMA185]AOW93202.1 hypothetical protein BFN03_12635 [Rhodococcus sp. WMMA185]
MTEQWPPTPPHQQGPSPNNLPYPPPVPESKPERPVPVDVGTAAQLLWAVAGLGLIQALVGTIVILGEKSTFVDQLLSDPRVTSNEIDLSRTAAENLFYVGIGVLGVFILLFTTLFLLFVHFMRKGRNWARMLLTLGCATIVAWAIMAVSATGSGGSGALVLGGVQILQAVAAVGAIVLMHRKDSTAYFLRLPPSDE